MRVFLLVTLLSSGSIFAQKAQDSSKALKSLTWSPDRSQIVPQWVLVNPDLSIHFKHLKVSSSKDAKMQPVEAEPTDNEEDSVE